MNFSQRTMLHCYAVSRVLLAKVHMKAVNSAAVEQRPHNLVPARNVLICITKSAGKISLLHLITYALATAIFLFPLDMPDMANDITQNVYERTGNMVPVKV